MTVNQIRERIEGILKFMHPHWEFVNCHMVSYLTDKHWERYVPAELCQEVESVERVRSCIESVFWRSNKGEPKESFTAFTNFLASCAQQRLENFPEILTSVRDLHKRLGKADDIEYDKTTVSIKEFMSEKKRHEVEITATLVNDLMLHNFNENLAKPLYIIDAGDGKGYLSSRLALQYGHKVLGIDFKETNTKNALERSKKLQRAWNGLTERAELENLGLTPPRRGKKQKNNSNTNMKNLNLQNYKTTSQFITPELNFIELLKQYFPTLCETESNMINAFCLTGLHTCGNLATTCLQVFDAQSQCKVLCNIGCCYHLLKEAFSGQEFFGNKAIMDMQSVVGFPMSRYLHEKQFSLGRNARMLAAQSIERTLNEKELPNISLYYRALLEVLICEKDAVLKGQLQVGKIRKFENFNEYLKLCDNKLNIGFNTSARSIDVDVEYANDKYYLELFYLLRMSFAPILESLILLDRLLYLKELGYAHSYLISVFDAVISPRHFGIIAIKK